MKELNLGILGAGRIGKVHAENVLKLSDVRLVTMADPYFSDEMAAWAAAQGTKILILAHLSRENNTAARARQAVERKLRTYGLEPGQDVTVTVAGPDEPGPVFELEEKEAALW